MNKIEKLESKKCKMCGYLQNKSHLRCLKCKNDTFNTLEAKGNCVLLTYTTLTALPMEFRDKSSYALGVVEFENGIRALGQISPNENLKIGMKLTSVYGEICKNLDGHEVYGYRFEPIT